MAGTLLELTIMTAVKGLVFEDAYKLSTIFNDDGLQIRVIHFNDLIRAKKATGRLKDLDDINQLQKRKKK